MALRADRTEFGVFTIHMLPQEKLPKPLLFISLSLSSGARIGEATHYSTLNLENPVDKRTWQATYSPWNYAESDTTEQNTRTGHLLAPNCS